MIKFFDWLFTRLFNSSIDGAVGVGEDERDFLIGDTLTLPYLDIQDRKIFEYNQLRSKHCTLYNPIGALSDLKNYEFSDKDIQEIVDMSYKRGRRKGHGRYTQLGVKTVCDWWNAKYPEDPVLYFKLNLDSQQAEEALNKNYTLCTTYRGNAKYNLDFLQDAKLDGYEFGKPTYGHSTSWIKRDGKRFVKDSYKGRKGKGGIACNIYELIPTPKQLVGTFYPAAYLIVNAPHKNKKEEIKRLMEMKKDVLKALNINSKLWNETNDNKYKNELHNMNQHNRQKMIDIDKEISKLS